MFVFAPADAASGRTPAFADPVTAEPDRLFATAAGPERIPAPITMQPLDPTLQPVVLRAWHAVLVSVSAGAWLLARCGPRFRALAARCARNRRAKTARARALHRLTAAQAGAERAPLASLELARNAVRSFLEERFACRTRCMTTTETAACARRLGLPRTKVRELERALCTLDLAVYGNRPPDAAELQTACGRLHVLIGEMDALPEPGTEACA